MRRSVCSRPNVLTSTGIGMPRPRRSTRFSAVISVTRWAEAAATIFSRSKAPPLPLIMRNCGSISSAPSRLRSRPLDLVQIAQRDLQAAGQLGGRRAGRHADDRQSLRRDAIGEVADHQRRGRARAEPDDHPIPDQARARAGGPILGGIRVHGHVTTPLWRRRSARAADADSSMRLAARAGPTANRGDQIRTGDLLLPRQAR